MRVTAPPRVFHWNTCMPIAHGPPSIFSGLQKLRTKTTWQPETTARLCAGIRSCAARPFPRLRMPTRDFCIPAMPGEQGRTRYWSIGRRPSGMDMTWACVTTRFSTAPLLRAMRRWRGLPPSSGRQATAENLPHAPRHCGRRSLPACMIRQRGISRTDCIRTGAGRHIFPSIRRRMRCTPACTGTARWRTGLPGVCGSAVCVLK